MIPFSRSSLCTFLLQPKSWINCPQKPFLLPDKDESKYLLLTIVDGFSYSPLQYPQLEKTLQRQFEYEIRLLSIQSGNEHELSLNGIRQAINRFGVSHPVGLIPGKINQKPGIYLFQSNDKSNPLHFWDFSVLKDIQRFTKDLTQHVVNHVSHFLTPLTCSDTLNRRAQKPFERFWQPNTLLTFPSHTHIDHENGRVFVSDTHHNRIIICQLDSGEILDKIGHGSAGLQDGEFSSCQLNQPAGTAFCSQSNRLFICDSLNHSIRIADLDSSSVTTLVTGSRWIGGQRFDENDRIKFLKTKFIDSNRVLNFFFGRKSAHSPQHNTIPSPKYPFGYIHRNHIGNQFLYKFARPSDFFINPFSWYVGDTAHDKYYPIDPIRNIGFDPRFHSRPLVGTQFKWPWPKDIPEDYQQPESQNPLNLFYKLMFPSTLRTNNDYHDQSIQQSKKFVSDEFHTSIRSKSGALDTLDNLEIQLNQMRWKFLFNIENDPLLHTDAFGFQDHIPDQITTTIPPLPLKPPPINCLEFPWECALVTDENGHQVLSVSNPTFSKILSLDFDHPKAVAIDSYLACTYDNSIRSLFNMNSKLSQVLAIESSPISLVDPKINPDHSSEYLTLSTSIDPLCNIDGLLWFKNLVEKHNLPVAFIPPGTNFISSLDSNHTVGSIHSGLRNDLPLFNRPAQTFPPIIDNDTLLVADTNNHHIRSVNLVRNTSSPWHLSKLQGILSTPVMENAPFLFHDDGPSPLPSPNGIGGHPRNVPVPIVRVINGRSLLSIDPILPSDEWKFVECVGARVEAFGPLVHVNSKRSLENQVLPFALDQDFLEADLIEEERMNGKPVAQQVYHTPEELLNRIFAQDSEYRPWEDKSTAWQIDVTTPPESDPETHLPLHIICETTMGFAQMNVDILTYITSTEKLCPSKDTPTDSKYSYLAHSPFSFSSQYQVAPSDQPVLNGTHNSSYFDYKSPWVYKKYDPSQVNFSQTWKPKTVSSQGPFSDQLNHKLGKDWKQPLVMEALGIDSPGIPAQQDLSFAPPVFQASLSTPQPSTQFGLDPVHPNIIVADYCQLKLGVIISDLYGRDPFNLHKDLPDFDPDIHSPQKYHDFARWWLEDSEILSDYHIDWNIEDGDRNSGQAWRNRHKNPLIINKELDVGRNLAQLISEGADQADHTLKLNVNHEEDRNYEDKMSNSEELKNTKKQPEIFHRIKNKPNSIKNWSMHIRQGYKGTLSDFKTTPSQIPRPQGNASYIKYMIHPGPAISAPHHGFGGNHPPVAATWLQTDRHVFQLDSREKNFDPLVMYW